MNKIQVVLGELRLHMNIVYCQAVIPLKITSQRKNKEEWNLLNKCNILSDTEFIKQYTIKICNTVLPFNELTNAILINKKIIYILKELKYDQLTIE